MDQILTIKEVGIQFDSEWVLLANPNVDEFGQVVSGTVVSHSKDRDEVYLRAIELKLKSSATLYTGKIPQGTAIIL